MKKEKLKKVLVVSPVPSHPQNVGNRTRIFNFLSNLKKLGYEVHFLYSYSKIVNPCPSSKLDLQNMYKKWDKLYVVPLDFKTKISNFIRNTDSKVGLIGLFLKRHFPFMHSLQKNLRTNVRKKQLTPPPIDSLYNTNLDKFLKKLTKKEKFDIVLVEYIFFSKTLNIFNKNTLKIIDTHDAFTKRYEYYSEKYPKYSGFLTSPSKEAKALNRADVIIAIQNKEKKFFEQIVDKNKKVLTMGHIIEPKMPVRRKSNRKNILFIGTNNYENQNAIEFFTQEVFPKIKKKFPDSRLILAGSICNSVPGKEEIVKLGEIENTDLAYEKANISISPVFFGTGLKIKNIEALAHCKPLITTTNSAKGLEKGKNKAFLIADTPEQFVKQIDKLFTNKKFYEKISKNAYEFMRNYNKKNIKTLKEVFK